MKPLFFLQGMPTQPLVHSEERNEPQCNRRWRVVLTCRSLNLPAKDRDAILMRFIENRSFAEVAVAMGTSEAAAKMRTGRALEKLRDLLEKRGSSLTLATLSAGLSATPRFPTRPNVTFPFR